MNREFVCKAIKEAIYEYRKRQMPVPEVLIRAETWEGFTKNPTIKDSEEVFDPDDLSRLFLLMSGFPY